MVRREGKEGTESDRSHAVHTVGYGELFRRNRDFRNLFAGRLVSLFGDWFNLLAILAMLRAFGDDSATGFAIVLVLKTLPGVLAPLGGVLADRLPRRNLMVFADVGRAVVVLGMAALAWAPSVPILYGLVVVQTLLSAVFEPARNAIFPDLVRPEELTAASAVSAATWSLMLALGSAAGGFVTDGLGWQTALWLDAATYVVSAGFLLRVREPDVARAPRASTGTVFDLLGIPDIVLGIRFVLGRPRIWTLALVKPTWQLTGARTLVLTLLGETAFQIAGWPMLAVSALYVSRGIGTGVGPIVARWLTASDPKAMERAILTSFVIASLGYVAVGLAPNLPLAALALIAAHLGGATIWVFSTIRLQQLTPSDVRGRVFAAEHAGLTLVMAASIAGFGRLGDLLDPLAETWLGPLVGWGDPAGVGARALAVGLGIVTLVPMGFWAWRGRWLGWAVEDQESRRIP